MAKKDFDLDYDYERDDDFDLDAILDGDYADEDLDLSQFDDDDILGLDLEQDSGTGYEDYDLEEAGASAAAAADSHDTYQDADFDAQFEMDPRDMAGASEPEEEEFFGVSHDSDEDLTADMDFSRRASFFGTEEENIPQPQYPQDNYDLPEEREPAEELPEQDFEEDEEPADDRSERRRERRRPQLPAIKLTMPPFVGKLIRLYFPSRQEINARIESAEGRKRRRPSKKQIFKEFYLPTIILGLTVILMLSFVIGAISSGIDRMKQEKERKEQLALQESLAAEQLATEGEALLARAETAAMGYDYDAAIDILDSYTGEMTQEMTTKKAEYMTARSALVEHQDPTLIPNLSFHVLMADPVRSFADANYGGLYNRNFVTTDEFAKILDQLYRNNFVLVDFDSFVSSNSVDGTSSNLYANSIWLPQGKRPVMITETMVNYYTYMVDSNKDGVADGGGAGFASKLVLDANGDIKAEYVDSSNTTMVGNYDLVPILEDFIAQHPDFCYRGARATLAVSGHEGIFGYRIQSETIANKGQDYYNKEVLGATEVVAALREKGYRLACYTFADTAYQNFSAAMILEDIQKWKSQISPVIGEVDTMVFAKTSDIGDYTGGKFDVLHDNGFRFLIKNADAPYTEVNTSFVRQSRLMVTGENMAWKASMFTDSGLFDPNTILDLSIRGNVPH